MIFIQKSDDKLLYNQMSANVGYLIYSNFIYGSSDTLESKIFGTNFEISFGIFLYQLISLINFSLFSLFLVTFSAVFGFLLSSNYINYFSLFILIISGVFITGSSVINNQIIEKNSDKLMNRTKNRPLPTNKISSIKFYNN